MANISTSAMFQRRDKYPRPTNVQGGSNMTGTDLCVYKLHYAAAVRP